MKSLRLAFYVAALVGSAQVSSAQSVETRSTLYGRVLDPQAAAIAGASVAVTNAETNVTVKLTTNETGYYEASLLLAGTYSVQAENTGFKKIHPRRDRSSDRHAPARRYDARTRLHDGNGGGDRRNTIAGRKHCQLRRAAGQSGGIGSPGTRRQPHAAWEAYAGSPGKRRQQVYCLYCFAGSSDFWIGAKVGAPEYSLDGALNSRGGSARFSPQYRRGTGSKDGDFELRASSAQATGLTVSHHHETRHQRFSGALS